MFTVQIPYATDATIAFSTTASTGGVIPQQFALQSGDRPPLTSFSAVQSVLPTAVFVNLILKRLKNIVADTERYDDEENPPEPQTIAAVHRYLDRLQREGARIESLAEVGTFYGEVSLTWRREDRRLSLIFQGAGMPKLYVERPRTPRLEESVAAAAALAWFDWLKTGVAPQGQIVFR